MLCKRWNIKRNQECPNKATAIWTFKNLKMPLCNGHALDTANFYRNLYGGFPEGTKMEPIRNA